MRKSSATRTGASPSDGSSTRRSRGRSTNARAPGEPDAPRAPHNPRDRAERRGLARAVRAEHRDDRALLDRERDAVQHVDGSVAGLDVLELEQCGHAASSPPRYAWITAG